jgi:hypothetical protein
VTPVKAEIIVDIIILIGGLVIVYGLSLVAVPLAFLFAGGGIIYLALGLENTLNEHIANKDQPDRYY